ncbi:hypothetical protein F4809DRAFT_353837 [Biscogniauxia mediterranea]|nr:hypothetical protein F4809DRAFT_353837 [Biscogniauxia mediterranea]
MDALKNMVGKKSESTGTQQQQGSTQQKSDFGDKAAEFMSKKAGVNTTADQREKATDSLRGAYEKSSGKQVNPKISN